MNTDVSCQQIKRIARIARIFASRYALATIRMQTLGKADTREFTMRESVPIRGK